MHRDAIRGRRKIRRLRRKKGGSLRVWTGKVGRGVLSLAMVASLTVLGFMVYQYSQRSLRLNVGEIKVMGCLHATEAELLEMASLDFRASLLNLDLRKVSSRIAQHPWVEKVKVRRDWSRRALTIEVRERVPQALILLEDLYWVDNHGEIFKRAGSKDRLDFPIFTGLESREIRERDPKAMGLIRQALDFLELLRQRKIFTPLEISEVHLSQQRGLTVFTLRGGIPIRLGSEEFPDKLNRLEKVLPDIQQKFKDVEYVDLSYPRKVVVKMKETEEKKSRNS